MLHVLENAIFSTLCTIAFWKLLLGIKELINIANIGHQLYANLFSYHDILIYVEDIEFFSLTQVTKFGEYYAS